MLKIHPPYFRFTGEICFSKVQQHSFIRFCIHCYPRMSHKSVHTQLTVCKQSRVAHLLSLIVYPDYTYFPSCSVDEYHRALDKAVYRLVRTYGWIFFDFLFFHFAASHNSKWKVKLTYSTVLLFWKLNSSRHLGGGGGGQGGSTVAHNCHGKTKNLTVTRTSLPVLLMNVTGNLTKLCIDL